MRLISHLPYLLLLIYFTSATSQAQEAAQEYIITSTGEKIMGKVTYAPGDKVSFRAEGTKQSREYTPTQIKAYFDKGHLYKTTYSVDKEEYFFFPYYQKGEDVKKFEKAAHLKIHATGPVSLYSFTKNYGGSTGNGFGGMATGSYKEVAAVLVTEKNGTLISFYPGGKQAPEEVLEVIKAHQTLADRIRNEKVKFDLDYLSLIISEYNTWYENQYATN
jgi:hypothetical protein